MPQRLIRTPDQRLRVFVSSTLQELAAERQAARAAIERLRLAPVMFELGARPHPAQELYRAYLEQSHIFVGIYWQKYGWVAPDMTISGLEDEYSLSGGKPKLIYIKSPAPNREPRLVEMLDRIKSDSISYKYFTTADELRETMLAALPAQSPERLPSMPLAAEISSSREWLSINETGWFRVRCVFERPNCLPLPKALLSDPSAAFQLAGFFDPDAPARPIRIALPVDTSPAGLRKFDKNAAFILSDILCGQVNRVQNIGFVDLVLSVLPWPFHKDLPMTNTGPCEDGGKICSLSIPIVTVCALV